MRVIAPSFDSTPNAILNSIGQSVMLHRGRFKGIAPPFQVI